MKKLLLSAVLASTALFSGLASADHHTYSLGYAQTEVKDFTDLKGVDFKYRYESSLSSFGMIAGVTWMQADDEAREGNKFAKAELTRYTFLIGPAYRINDFVSLYALGGVSVNKWDFSSHYYTYTESRTAVAYGVGAQFNPIDHLAIDLGYQGGETVGKLATNGFTISVGYRF